MIMDKNKPVVGKLSKLNFFVCWNMQMNGLTGTVISASQVKPGQP